MIVDIIQIKFIDKLIQLSPNLSILKFKAMQIDDALRENNIYFAPFNNRNLK